MIGGMRHFIKIVEGSRTKDSQGFAVRDDVVLAETRAYKESRHGSAKWKNRAAFTTANTLFRFRKIPTIEVSTAMAILHGSDRYNILSIEDIRGMYVEVLAEKVLPTM